VRDMDIVSSPRSGEGDREAVEGPFAVAPTLCPSTALRAVPLPAERGGDGL